MEVGSGLNTPVLFLVFNRPESTFKVFEEIKKAKPTRLYIAADGPRSGKEGEIEKCEAVRKIATMVEWDCDVKTLFRENNLGCKKAVSSAITWFFSEEKEGIVLEDDCLPNQSFFQFCSTMLLKYRDDHEVMHIGGCNFISDRIDVDGSYYFSRYNHIWGWASWQRAWNTYDVDMKELPAYYARKDINKLFGKNGAKYYWLYKFIRLYEGKIDTWDYQWTFAIWKNFGKSITPAVNLVSNIGFEGDATHDMSNVRNLSGLSRHEMSIFKDPQQLKINLNSDTISDVIVFKLTFWRKVASFFLVQFETRKLKR